MQCPTCTTVSLVMSERHGVEIDYCPKCRGVWLNRGELDKILERASDSAPAPAALAPAPRSAPLHHHTPAPSHPSYPPSHSVPPVPHHPHYYKHKRKSWLSDILDFD